MMVPRRSMPFGRIEEYRGVRQLAYVSVLARTLRWLIAGAPGAKYPHQAAVLQSSESMFSLPLPRTHQRLRHHHTPPVHRRRPRTRERDVCISNNHQLKSQVTNQRVAETTVSYASPRTPGTRVPVGWVAMDPEQIGVTYNVFNFVDSSSDLLVRHIVMSLSVIRCRSSPTRRWWRLRGCTNLIFLPSPVARRTIVNG